MTMHKNSISQTIHVAQFPQHPNVATTVHAVSNKMLIVIAHNYEPDVE